MLRLVCTLVLFTCFVACGNGDIPEPEDYFVLHENGEADIPRLNEYRVSLDIDTANRTASGISHITFTNRADSAVSEIAMRVHERVEIHYAFLDAVPLEFYRYGEALTVYLPDPLAPLDTVQILLQFDGTIAGTSFALWTGGFLPTIDDHETANFRVDITTPALYVVTGTGLRTEEVIDDTDTKISTFTAQQARNFAFALSPEFRHAHAQTDSGIDLHLYFYSDYLDTDWILSTARFLVELFEEAFGGFPFGHITFVEAEFPGASFSRLIYFESGAAVITPTISRGIANQWFGQVVGASEPWLTDGIVAFLAGGDGDDEVFEFFLNLYDYMGNENFYRLLREFYQAFSFRIATPEDFMEISQQISDGRQHDENLVHPW